MKPKVGRASGDRFFLPDLPDLPVMASRLTAAPSRREFVQALAATALALRGFPASAQDLSCLPDLPDLPVISSLAQSTPGARIRKAVLISMLPKELSYAERFALGRAAGFDGIEMQTIADPDEAAEVLAASKATGLHIHSVMNADHWRFPLSSRDGPTVARSVAGMETSLRNAALWGADVVLLVPAVVDADTSYRDAWTRSQQVIRERLLPMASALNVVIAVEEVWNKFLLSPLEFARYVDEFGSPQLKAYFDVGNVVFYGFPQDWIRVLGQRIAKVHLKDFQLDRPNGRFGWRNLGEGDIDWMAVRQALTDVGYAGYVTTEVAAGDAAYLRDLAQRVDRFLAGQRPVSGP
jgi:L-ribulose-5-phosphate 3-epimerase